MIQTGFVLTAIAKATSLLNAFSFMAIPTGIMNNNNVPHSHLVSEVVVDVLTAQDEVVVALILHILQRTLSRAILSLLRIR